MNSMSTSPPAGRSMDDRFATKISDVATEEKTFALERISAASPTCCPFTLLCGCGFFVCSDLKHTARPSDRVTFVYNARAKTLTRSGDSSKSCCGSSDMRLGAKGMGTWTQGTQVNTMMTGCCPCALDEETRWDLMSNGTVCPTKNRAMRLGFKDEQCVLVPDGRKEVLVFSSILEAAKQDTGSNMY